MKKRIAYFILAAVLLMACGITVNLTPEPANATPTLIVMPLATVPATEPVTQPVIRVNAICNELSFYLDPVLGSGYSCQTFAESTGVDVPDFALTPEYTHITFQNYPLVVTLFYAFIDVLPVQRFRQLAPDLVNSSLADLQALIAGGTAGSGDLPLLPALNAGQVFYSQAAVIQFQNGRGVRYLTEYAQYTAPINNNDLIYTFQGLTDDGQFWISVILPISNPILPANGDNPPNGQSWEDFSNSYEPYLADITVQLNAQGPGSFTPTITMLDALVNSIIVQP